MAISTWRGTLSCMNIDISIHESYAPGLLSRLFSVGDMASRMTLASFDIETLHRSASWINRTTQQDAISAGELVLLLCSTESHAVSVFII